MTTLRGDSRPPRRPPPPPPPPRGGQKGKLPPKKRHSFLWTLFKTFLTAGIWVASFAVLAVFWFSYDLPDIEKLQLSNRKPSVTIQTMDGTVLTTYGDLYEDMVKLNELPPYVYQAVLSIEDRRFYHHFGVDLIGLIRAAYTNYQADRVVQGGSTITQQLAKNFLITQGMYGTNDRSLRRKIQEVIMAVWLEWHFTKEQILTIYLNRVYLGSGAYGIDAASRKYFGRSARQLNVYQSAVIAGLLKAPSKYSPLANPDRAYERAQVVLHQMQDEGYIPSADQYLAQAKQELKQTAEERGQSGVKFFTDWVYDQIPNYTAIDQDLVVVVTLDPAMQRHGEKVCTEYLDTLGKDLKASEMALVTMLPDGAVKTMVGGRDYKKSQFNRVTQALRQPGSGFKSFVYLAAVEEGMTPETMIEDTPVQIGNWAPSNFKHVAQGEVSLRYALAKSVNAVTVRLGMAVGAPKIIEVANRLGITSKMTPDLSITLGSMDTTLLQITSAFATYAHQGFAVWPYGILEIRDKSGKILYKHDAGQPTRIIAQQHLEYMRDMLNAVVKEGTGRNAKSAVGGKTGSNRDQDVWFIGYTNNLVAGVWAGNDKNEPMLKKSVGALLPAKTWEAFISGVNNMILKNDIESSSIDSSSPQAKLTGNGAKNAQSPLSETELAQDNIDDLIEAVARQNETSPRLNKKNP